MFMKMHGSYAEKLDRLEDAISSPSLMFFLETDYDNFLRLRTATTFDAEGNGRVGGIWQELSWATQQIRSASGFHPRHPINHRTGEFRGWLTSKTSPRLTPDPNGASMQWPGPAPHAELANKLLVAQQGRGTTPARPVLGVDGADFTGLHRLLSAYISRQIR